MTTPLAGLHHVTAITGDAQRNLDFYTGVLGLRLVKLTVNYDDPGSYHLYYGDELGRPGSIVTFFAWPGAPRGRSGAGQLASLAFTVPEGALESWAARLAAQGTETATATRFGQQALTFADPDGLALELVDHPQATQRAAWAQGPLPAEHAIRGLHAITLWEEKAARTTQTLEATLGFRPLAVEDGLRRYATGAGGPGALLDVRERPGERRGSIAAGSIHHVAWRTPDEAAQQEWLRVVTDASLHASPVMDRQYFHSIYFREPGGALFEVATDVPGFATDESPDHLGTRLTLPPWLEAHRVVITEALPPLRLPTPVAR